MRTLVPGRTYRPARSRSSSTGISDEGITLADGSYLPVVHLAPLAPDDRAAEQIGLDTKPPTISVRHRIYSHISPDGDGRKTSSAFPTASAGRRTRSCSSTAGRLPAAVGRSGRRARLERQGRRQAGAPGNYVLEVSAQDEAGNRAKPYPFAVVQVRYVALGRTRVLARPRHATSRCACSPTRREVTWRSAAGTGSRSSGTLRLRAPRKPGVYRLYVGASGHAAKALVVVA